MNKYSWLSIGLAAAMLLSHATGHVFSLWEVACGAFLCGGNLGLWAGLRRL